MKSLQGRSLQVNTLLISILLWKTEKPEVAPDGLASDWSCISPFTQLALATLRARASSGGF